MTWPHGDPNAVARAIVAAPAYRASHATTAAEPTPSLLTVAFRWFVEHVLVPIFKPLAHAAAASSTAGTVIGIVLVVAALVALAIAIVRLALAFARPAARAVADPANEPLGTHRTAAAWRVAARAAAERGEIARAIAALWAAALVLLDDASLVVFDAARTPGEYRRLVRRARAPAAPPFDELSARFVRAAFSSDAPGPGDYRAAERALDTLEPTLAG